MTDITPIRTHDDYVSTVRRIEELFDAHPHTADADELELLLALVKAHEEKHFEIPLPDPIEAILYYVEARGLSRQDLEPLIGSRSRVSEILNRKRQLTLPMIRRLSAGIGIPSEVLVQPYELAQPVPEPLVWRHNILAALEEINTKDRYYEIATGLLAHDLAPEPKRRFVLNELISRSETVRVYRDISTTFFLQVLGEEPPSGSLSSSLEFSHPPGPSTLWHLLHDMPAHASLSVSQGMP
jgi:HTH-type transcriptional regulator/antitoxin HigA